MNDEIPQNPEPESVPPPQPETPAQPAAPQTSYRPSAPPPPPAPSRRSNYLIPVAIAVGCLPWVILFALALGGIISAAVGGGAAGRGNLALIRVGGVITAGRSNAGPFGGGSVGSEDLVSQLEKARKDSGIKAIVIRINSPGGSAAGSEEAWNEIMRIRKSGKPVYTSMGDVAASGGYYIASATNRIFADASTITGSIGVIYSGADMSDLYKKIGFRPEIIKSGKFKDIGSPARALTPEETALIQGVVNDTFGRFVQAVADGRKLPVADVKKIADGRIFTGDQAMKIKLVDELGGLRETILSAARAGRIRGEPKIVEYQHRGLLGLLNSESDSSDSSNMDGALTRELLRELLRQEGASGGLK